jgi:hypothetical protein
MSRLSHLPPVRITTSLSVPDSAPHTSPGRFEISSLPGIPLVEPAAALRIEPPPPFAQANGEEIPK